MQKFTNTEYADMHLIYGECRCVAARAADLYRERYFERQHPDRKTFADLDRRLRESGSFLPKKEGTGLRLDVIVTEDIVDRVEADPGTSTRRIARDVGMSQSTVCCTLRAAHLYPYHHMPVQELLEEDYDRCLNFCYWLLARFEADENFLRNILFTDESLFTRAGIFNSHNTHTYALANPHCTRVRSYQHRWKLNIWAGLIGSSVIGPILLPDNVDGQTYSTVLEQVYYELLEDLPLQVRSTMWFQQDGAPVHNTRRVTEFLNTHFQNRWLGYRGYVQWPPRSPDLTPMDFYFWGYLKQEVYVSELDSPEEAIARIHAAVANIDRRTLDGVQTELLRRARACIEAEGGHFEHYLTDRRDERQ